MDFDEFQKEADRVKAEQFFEEKTAQPHVSALDAVVAAAREPADPELYKVAQFYCPEDALRFYVEELGGQFKAVR